jgi:hypothetical protein
MFVLGLEVRPLPDLAPALRDTECEGPARLLRAAARSRHGIDGLLPAPAACTTSTGGHKAYAVASTASALRLARRCEGGCTGWSFSARA